MQNKDIIFLINWSQDRTFLKKVIFGVVLQNVYKVKFKIKIKIDQVQKFCSEYLFLQQIQSIIQIRVNGTGSMKIHKKSTKKQSQSIVLTAIPFPRDLNIITLDLSHNKIAAIQNINKLKHLTSLDLSFNRISKIQNIFDLHKLETISFNDNLIQYLPRELTNMSSLTHLDLRNNKILYVHAIATLEGKNMISLKLEGNKVTKRPKFQQMISKILDPEKSQQYKYNMSVGQLTCQIKQQQTQKQLETVMFTTSVQFEGTLGSMTSVQSKLINESTQEYQQPSEILKTIQQTLSFKRDQIINKHHGMVVAFSKLEIMLEQDTAQRQNQADFSKVVIQFIKTIVRNLKESNQKISNEMESVMENFQSCNPFQQIILFSDIFTNQVSQSQGLLRQCLNHPQDDKRLELYIPIIRKYLYQQNEFKKQANQLSQLILDYSKTFNHLYKIVELKKMLDEPEVNICLESQPTTLQQYINTVSELQVELDTKNQIQQDLIRQNNTLLESVDRLKQQNNSLCQQITTLKQRWLLLQQMRQQGNIMLDKVIQKQDVIITMMQQKLTGDFFQKAVLNQAQTIQTLLQANKYIKDRITIQQINQKIYNYNYDKTSPVKTDNIQQTGKKKIVKITSKLQYSAESNLLSDQCPQDVPRNKGYKPNYFNKSVDILKSKTVSQPTTHRQQRNDAKNTTIETQRGDRHKMFPSVSQFLGTIDKRFRYKTEQLQQSDSYKQYKKYYLRNNILDVLVQKNTHQKVKQRYGQKQLRLRKFSRICGKSIITAK